MSSLDFIQIQEECNALLKTKAHSFKALPALFLLDQVDVVKESTLSPNVIMVRTLPHMKVSIETAEEQQEKFRLSIANWCLANEGMWPMSNVHFTCVYFSQLFVYFFK